MGDGGGIVPYNPPQKNSVPIRRRSFVSDGRGHNETIHYDSVPRTSSNAFTRILREHFTAGGINEKLLRKTTKKNTWIYAADRNLNLYIGIKDTGTFQHSSFLSGGLVASAGLIKVNQGLITSLSPLSGHYRTKVNSFMKFVTCLENQGVDLHKVQISKAEIILWGLEKWKKFQKGQLTVVRNAKADFVESVHTAKKRVSTLPRPNGDQDENKWKLEILLGRKRSSY